VKQNYDAINLLNARLCLDCEPGTIHHAESCPVCGSRAWYYLQTWIEPNRAGHLAWQRNSMEAQT